MQKTSRAKQAIGQGSQQILDFIDTLLTNAQLLALNGTPIAVVPAPGPNWALILDCVECYYQYGSAGFTIGSATGIGFKYTDGSGLQVAQCAVTGFLDQTANKLRAALGYCAASGDSSIVPVANAPIVAQMLSANVTGGSGSTLKLRAYFRRIPATL